VAARFVSRRVTAGRPPSPVGAAREDARHVHTQYLELKRRVPLEEIYTNDLLPEKK